MRGKGRMIDSKFPSFPSNSLSLLLEGPQLIRMGVRPIAELLSALEITTCSLPEGDSPPVCAGLGASSAADQQTRSQGRPPFALYTGASDHESAVAKQVHDRFHLDRLRAFGLPPSGPSLPTAPSPTRTAHHPLNATSFQKTSGRTRSLCFRGTQWQS